MLLRHFRLRRNAGVAIFAIFSILALMVVYLVLAIIHGTRSDKEISEYVKKLLPAGHCLCESSTVFDCRLSLPDILKDKTGIDIVPTNSMEGEWQFNYERDGLNFGLSNDQCIVAFPGLFDEVHRAVAVTHARQSNISVSELDAIEIKHGLVRAIIVDRKLRILETKYQYGDQQKKGLAILYSIYRSILTNGQAIPNIEFVFSVDDMVDHPSQPIWTLTRRSQDHNLWLMPDFGFWSWDLQDIGTLDDITEQVIRDETASGWDNKIQKLMWRGKPHMLPKLRFALLDASKGKSWSDVEALVPVGPGLFSENYVGAADQCKYMFLVHAEGRSYSGSLKYRQICHSVIIIHKMQWIQHHHYLLVANGTEQNFLEVERDFSDLETKIEYLLANPEEAKRIADNNVKTFRERYFAPAAEACYWRALIHGWAASSFQPQVFKSTPGGGLGRPRGMRFENFALLETHNQIEFKWDSDDLRSRG